jgi:hypothetical protein
MSEKKNGLVNRAKLQNAVKKENMVHLNEYAKRTGRNKSVVLDEMFEYHQELCEVIDTLSLLYKKEKIELVREAIQLLKEKYEKTS